MSISLNTANSNSIASYDTIDGDGNVHNDQASEIALLSAKQPDKLSEIVNSFSNTSIFCEIALQRLQLSQSYRTNAGMQMEQMKEYQGQITALNMLDQYAREGKTIKIEAPENLEQYKSNVEQARKELFALLTNRTDADNAQEVDKFKKELQELIDNDYKDNPEFRKKVSFKANEVEKFITNTVSVSDNLKSLLESIGTKVDYIEEYKCDLFYGTKLSFNNNNSMFIGLTTKTLDPVRLNKDELNNLISRIDSESTIQVNANALLSMGFTEVPKFADSKIGEAEKEKFTVKIEMKKDEVDHKMNTTMAYLQDYVEQAQANITKASKNLDKYDELLAEVVSKKK